MNKDVAYWESQYNNRAAVPDFQQYFDRWAARSGETRRRVRCHLDVPYGPGEHETIDIDVQQGQ